LEGEIKITTPTPRLPSGKAPRTSWTRIKPPVSATTALSASLLIYGRGEKKRRNIAG